MKRYSISHETTYHYATTVELGLHEARLSPVNAPHQKLLEHEIEVTPVPTWTVAFIDHFGNNMQHIAIEESHDALTVIQRSVVEIDVPRGTLNAGPAWESLREAMLEDDYPDVAEFIYPSPHVILDDAATDFALQAFTPGAPVAEAALKLACLFKSEFTYAPGATTISTTVPEILEGRRGVCQDFAHAMIAGLRALKIPVRYVSGYLKTYAPSRAGEDSPALVGADATHAWVSVWCGPELGWMDFDPTNALAVTDEHIAVAYGRDFSDVTPLRGVIVGGGTHTPDVRVTVTHLDG